MTHEIQKLVMKHLTFRYADHGRTIIENLSLELPRPSVTTLLGLNGAGKTTLLMLLLGYFKASSGEIFVQSEKGQESIQGLNGMVGYLPQRENIPFDYSVTEFILLGRNTHIGLFGAPGREDCRQIQEAMQFMDISDLAERRLSSISGGELQRVRIARLLVQDPTIILLDEPSSHLDVKSKKQIIELIGRFKELGKIVIYSTHDPLDALNYSDYSVIMRKNAPSLCGKSSEIIDQASLCTYFDTKMVIREIDGQKVIVIENGYKTTISS